MRNAERGRVKESAAAGSGQMAGANVGTSGAALLPTGASKSAAKANAIEALEVWR